MKTFIKPSKIDGRVEAPPSKSMMLRAVAAAGLASGRSRILNPSFCDDAQAALGIVEMLGADIQLTTPGSLEASPIPILRNFRSIAIKDETPEPVTLAVTGGKITGGGDLFCGESGFCMRLFTPIAALSAVERSLHGRESLAARPVGPVEDPLRSLGAECLTRKGFPPVRVRGPLRGGDCRIDAGLSSQFLSGLLFALPLAEKPSIVRVSALNSKPYVEMTRRVLKDFGVGIEADGNREFFIDAPQNFRPREFRIEGDWSGAAFLLVAGAVAGRVRVSGLDLESSQADRHILSALEDCGARIGHAGGDVVVERTAMRAFHFDAVDCPDLFPPLAALACYCEGTSRIRGVHRLRAKESDRAAALAGEFSAAGADVGLEGDMLVIRGRPPAGGAARARGDHRIAMALAVAGLGAGSGIAVDGAECVSKSYPEFFRDLSRIGANIHE